MNLYNLFQVVANVLLVYGYWSNGWGTYYNWCKYYITKIQYISLIETITYFHKFPHSVCQGLDPDPKPGSQGYNMAIVALGAYLIRYVDFLDTLFFILRKKFGNVSTLQANILYVFSQLLKALGAGFVNL